jgi:hypothetical protein
MQGSVEVVQVSAGKLQVKLLGEEGGVFGICALDQGSPSQNCRASTDSPSAFIIRIDQGGDAAHLGIQFVERTAAIAFSGLTSLTRATPTGSPVESTVRRHAARSSGQSSKMQLNLEGKVRTVSGAAVFARSSDEVEDAVRVQLSSPPPPSGVQRRFAAGTGPRPPVTSTPAPSVQSEAAAQETIAPPTTVVSPPKPASVDLDDIFNSPAKQPPQASGTKAEWDAPQPTKPKDAFDDFFN